MSDEERNSFFKEMGFVFENNNTEKEVIDTEHNITYESSIVVPVANNKMKKSLRNSARRIHRILAENKKDKTLIIPKDLTSNKHTYFVACDKIGDRTSKQKKHARKRINQKRGSNNK